MGKFICVQCGEQFDQRLRNRRRAVQFAKMNGNSCVAAARNGQRSKRLQTGHRNRFEDEAPRLSESAQNRNLQ
jgi:hypothetical protein